MKLTLSNAQFFKYFRDELKEFPKKGELCMLIDGDPLDRTIDIEVGKISYHKCAYRGDEEYPCNICKGAASIGKRKGREYRCCSFDNFPYVRKINRYLAKQLKWLGIVEAL